MRHMTHRTVLTVITAVLSVSLSVVSAAAQVDLRFDPPDTTVAVDETCRMSILLDTSLEVRTIDVNVTYDTTVVRTLGGGAGSLYTSSGLFTFQGFEEDTLGHWHGYSVIIGADKFVLGPGELFYWDFSALADGVTPITAIEIYLSTTDGSWFDNVMLPTATVTVGDGTSEAPAVPALRSGLHLWPNPFNPGTRVRGELPRSGPVTLSVYDLKGRRVAVLRDGFADAGPLVADWDGRFADGRRAPGGAYLFHLDGPGFRRTTKGVLTK